MGLREAGKYISDLRQKQGDPYLWPDYVTGLPNTNAIVKKTTEVYPKLGRYAISLIRIANIHPYLLKYGPERHSSIIQWAAAAIKTTSDKHDGFVGALGSHDFVLVCKTGKTGQILSEASEIFEKKIRTFYTKADLEKNSVLSYKNGGKTTNVGLMKLIWSTMDSPTRIAKENIIPHLSKLCNKLESE